MLESKGIRKFKLTEPVLCKFCGKHVQNTETVKRSMENNPKGAACFDDYWSQGCAFYNAYRRRQMIDGINAMLNKAKAEKQVRAEIIQELRNRAH